MSQTQMSGILAHLAERVLNRPLLLHPDKADVILNVLQGRIGITSLEPLTPEANRFVGSKIREKGDFSSIAVHNGVALIPIVGSLVNRGAWVGAQSGLVSYEGLAAQLREAANDPEVSAIMLDIDSGGGEATGMHALARQIAKINQSKPVYAFINDVAASAAYGIASAAREIIVSPSSILGSIGVLLIHMDHSGALAKAGIKPTLIHAGANKVDGNPFEPLPEAVRGDMQDKIGKFYEQFVGLVAEGRAGRMSAAQIRATEARTYMGAEAVELGLADRIASLDEALTLISQPAHGATSNMSGFAMSKTHQADAPQAQNMGATEADQTAAIEAARAEGLAAGKAEATDRIKMILQAEEAKGREAQAMAMALETSMSADEAIKVLGASPKANTAGASFEQRAQGEAEFGGNDQAHQSPAQTSAHLWGQAVKRANAANSVRA